MAPTAAVAARRRQRRAARGASRTHGGGAVPVDRITSADDPRVLDYRAVREPDLVRRRGLFIAEGRLVVARLLALSRYTIRSILVSEAGLAALREHAAGGLASRP